MSEQSDPKQGRVANRWKLRAPQLRPPASRHPGFAQETTVGPKHDCFEHLLPACGCVQFLDCASSIGPLCLRQHGWDYFFFCAAAQHSDHQKGLAHQEGAYFSLALKAFLCFFVCVGVGCSFLPNIDDSDTGSRCGKYEAAVLRSTFRLFVSSPQKSCFCLSPFFSFSET